MAITIIDTPDTHTPVYNPVEWTCSSTNTGQTNFKYIVQVYVGGSEVAFLRIKPEPDTGNDLLIVDVSEILQTQLTQDLYGVASTKGILDGNESFVQYQMRFGEEYGSTPTQYLNDQNQTEIAFNGGIRYSDFVDFTSATYLDTKFLTNMPNPQTTDLSGLGALHLLLASGTTLTNLTIKTYLATVLQNTYVVTTALSPTDYYLFAAGVDAINNINPSNFTVPPTQPIITNSIDQYTVEVTLSTGTTEIFTFDIVEGCLEDEPLRVHYLNEWGGYDWFDFKLARKDSYQATSQRMEMQPNNLTTPGNLLYAKTDRVARDYCTNVVQSITVNSDWLTDAQMENMRELISSPDIYIEDGTDLIAVNITNKNILVKQARYDEVFQQELTFEYAIKQNRQKF
jgi:hypothetical protein